MCELDTILKATNITKKYGKHTVLDKVNMTINRGDIYGFIGRNGAGKTTFMRAVLSLNFPEEGEIELFGSKDFSKVGLRIGSLIEAPGIYKNCTAYENMKRFSILYGADGSKINEILNYVGLGKTGKKKAKDFSLGMKQRLGIAIALLGDPELLLLDEPINGLDPAGIKDIRDLILKLNTEKHITILISSHILDELSKIVTRYGIINSGVMVEEIEAAELEEKCKKKLIIEVDDVERATQILSKMLNPNEISVNRKRIQIESHIEEASEINENLVKGNVKVFSLYAQHDDLEEYFMKKVGA